MNFHLHRSTETSVGAGVAAAIALAALTMLASGFLPDGDAQLSSGGLGLAATLDRLGFAYAFAYGEVMQAASDAVRTRVVKSLPGATAI
jgi:hypothetical protein